jgi:hypothetical protein
MDHATHAHRDVVAAEAAEPECGKESVEGNKEISRRME